MTRLQRLFRFLLPTLLLVLGSTAAAQTASNLQKTVKPFLKKHCNRCHNAKKQEGNIRVDQLNWDLEDLSSIDELQHILDEVVVDSMPPDSEPRPSDDELEKFSKAISEHIQKAKDKYRSGGGRPIRRLTKTEYVNTLYDLLGVRVNTERMPPDGVAGTFDTQAIDLYTTDAHLETSLEVGRAAAANFIASRNMEPGEREPKRLGAPKFKKGLFQIKAENVPPAGHQILRLVVRQKYEQSEATYIGPVNNAVFEVSGTSDSPQRIDRTFFESGSESWNVNSNVEIDDVESIQVINPQPYEFFAKYQK